MGGIFSLGVIFFVYIFYTGPDKSYAYIGESKRVGGKNVVSSQYLGRVIDREAGIYKSKERGIFTFNLEANQYGTPPESYVPPVLNDRRRREKADDALDFGDAFFVDWFIRSTGFMDVIDTLKYGNPDTLHAMVLFYVLSNLANSDAITWYKGNIVKYLYPKADFNGQRISDFLASVGRESKTQVFQKNYISFINEHYCKDHAILIDSTGLPNSIHMPMTCKNIHNGVLHNEVRLIYVVQRSTGLPLYYTPIHGNVVDVSTLEFVLANLEELGVDVSLCIIDAGYDSGTNLDLFYDKEKKECKIGYIVRADSNDKRLLKMVEEEMASMNNRENFVQYQDRYLFIKKRQVFVGSNEDMPAWLYLGIDMNRMTDERHKLFDRASKKKLTKDMVYDLMHDEGVFGIISGFEYTIDEILPAYYQRQAAEQIFDFAKNYTKLLPLRTQSPETFKGHLAISYIACIVVKMLQMRFKEVDLFLGGKLLSLRNQKCLIYKDGITIFPPQAPGSEIYKLFKFESPVKLPFVDGRLAYDYPESGSVPPEPPTKRTGGKPARTSEKQLDQNPKHQEHENQDSCVCSEAQHSDEKTTVPPDEVTPVPPKRGKGRPKGSLNKKTIARKAAEAANPPVKRGPGRPKGSLNKKTIARMASQASAPGA